VDVLKVFTVPLCNSLFMNHPSFSVMRSELLPASAVYQQVNDKISEDEIRAHRY
jgi:hypothetical protein